MVSLTCSLGSILVVIWRSTCFFSNRKPFNISRSTCFFKLETYFFDTSRSRAHQKTWKPVKVREYKKCLKGQGIFKISLIVGIFLKYWNFGVANPIIIIKNYKKIFYQPIIIWNKHSKLHSIPTINKKSSCHDFDCYVFVLD